MGHIYKNLKAIPIPADAHVNHYDNRVFQEYKDGGRRCKRTIGVLAKEGFMHVNDVFRRYYSDLWQTYYGEKVPPMRQIHAGLYAMTLGIVQKTGLYAILRNCFGPQHANAILDYAMFGIRDRSSTTQLFPVEMEDQMLFSRKPLSDTAYSELFKTGITGDQIHAFKTAWLEKMANGQQSEDKEEKVKKVWICIDGSNNDCETSNSNLVEVGHAKSHRETNIVSYIWAVDADSGRPITWFVKNGATPDCKSVDEVIKFLSSSKMAIEGVIMDRGFASSKVLELAVSRKLKYIVMLKTETNGFTEMLVKHSEDIRWKMSHVIGNEPLFGVTDQVRLFAGDQQNTCVGLYFAGSRSCSRIASLIRKMQAATAELRKQIGREVEHARVPVELKKFINIKEKDGIIAGVDWNAPALQASADSYGFHAIASSETLSAQEIHDLYQLRDVSEKQFSQLKSQLNGGVTRVHSDDSIQSRFAIGFVESIIRTEIELACRELEMDTNLMIRKADRAHMMRMAGGNYEAIQDIANDSCRLFKKFGILPGHFEKFAEEVNSQEQKTIYDQEREIPSLELPKRGRRKGSKNKKTLEREAREKELAAQGVINIEEKPKRKPGRPKGRKNNKTLEREALEALTPKPPKRRPGRPKGAKNKKTLEREARLAAQKTKIEKTRLRKSVVQQKERTPTKTEEVRSGKTHQDKSMNLAKTTPEKRAGFDSTEPSIKGSQEPNFDPFKESS